MKYSSIVQQSKPLMAKPYISEATTFIASLKTKNPQLEQAQRDGRALLWDKAVNLQALAIEQANTLPSKAYQYSTKPDPR
jgi:Protein of unknown function (DUF3460)